MMSQIINIKIRMIYMMQLKNYLMSLKIMVIL